MEPDNQLTTIVKSGNAHFLKMLAVCVTVFCSACRNETHQVTKPGVKGTADNRDNIPQGKPASESAETLLFENDVISTFTTDRIQGKGVVSFFLEPGDTLSIQNSDGSDFGELIANTDLSFTISLPKKVVARNLVPDYDVASFEFDAEPIASDKEFIKLYINGLQKRIHKGRVKCAFRTWEEYLRESVIKLKNGNILRGSDGSPVAHQKDLKYEVLEVKGDTIRLKSSRSCITDGVAFKNLDGWAQWKSGNKLQIEFSNCE
ncbi:MAG: hypothetical protein EOO01_21650 [Chitinophagaceae bacterium]|nr:MAG: hypothetical protein EOO01_21650 [Chitinophagaceae bacterium]